MDQVPTWKGDLIYPKKKTLLIVIIYSKYFYKLIVYLLSCDIPDIVIVACDIKSIDKYWSKLQ